MSEHTLDDLAAKSAQPSRLARLIALWENLGQWGEQELFLEIADDLCSIGRYNAPKRLMDRVFDPNGPEAHVMVSKAEWQASAEPAPPPAAPVVTIDERNIGLWAEITFPDSGPKSLLKHMREELSELTEEVRAYDPSDPEDDGCFKIEDEIGDLGLMLVHLARMFGVTFADCVMNKFAIARKRTYQYDPELGYAKHVDDALRGADLAPEGARDGQ